MFYLFLIYGFINSAIILLQSLGFGLTFSISGIANFSHGALYILAGVITWILIKYGLPVYLSMLLSVFTVALLGFVIYWLLIYRIRGLPFSEVIVTFLLGVVIIEFLRWKGFVTYEFTLPALSSRSVFILGIPLDFQRLIILFFAFLLLGALYIFSHFTKIGLALRGISQNEQTALCLGINADLFSSISVMLGAGICAISANLIIPLGIISIDSGYDVLLISIAVTIVGGLGSNLGLLLASLLFGYVQTATTIFLSSKWVMVVYLFSIICVLMIKPSGLLGKFKEIEERI